MCRQAIRASKAYVQTGADAVKLPFLAIDAPTGRTIETNFDEEQCRLALEITKHRPTPPFPDPLPTDEKAEPEPQNA